MIVDKLITGNLVFQNKMCTILTKINILLKYFFLDIKCRFKILHVTPINYFNFFYESKVKRLSSTLFISMQ